MRKLHIVIPGIVGLGLVLAGGVAAVAQRGAEQPAKSLQQTTAQTEISTPVAPVAETTQTAVQATIPADPCRSTITEAEETSGSNSTNSKLTVVHCENRSGGGSTSIDVTSNIDQSSTTGESTGQSGTASNTNTTTTDIDIDL